MSVTIDGHEYEEVDTDTLPFTNVCNFCAFKGTDCFTRRDFSCHSDARPDGRSVVFRRIPNTELTGAKRPV